MKITVHFKKHLSYLVFIFLSSSMFSQFALKTLILDKKYYDVLGIALRKKELEAIEDYERRGRDITLATARILLTNGLEKIGKSDLKRIDDFWQNYFSQYTILCDAYILSRKKKICKQRMNYLKNVNHTLFAFLFGARTKHKVPNGTVDKILQEYSSIHDALITELEIIRKEVEREAPLRSNLLKYKNGI